MKALDRELWPETIHGRWMQKEGTRNLVSVIIPTLNRKRFVLEAVASVWDQTYRPIELIVVDDGSTDGTREALKDWTEERAQDSNFEVRYLWQRNMGVSAARNRGLIESRGAYIQFLDSDDLLLSERLSQCMQAFGKNEIVELVHSAFYLKYYANSDSKVVKAAPASFGTSPGPMHSIWTAAGLFSRAVIFESGPWNEGLTVCEDSEYFSRVLAVVEKSCPVPEPLIIKRKHEGPRLEDRRWSESGLTDKMRSFLMQERILQSCGYDETQYVGRWLQLAQDALVVELADLARKALDHSRELSKGKLRWKLRWHVLNILASVHPQLGKTSCRLANTINVKLKRLRRNHRGPTSRIRNHH